MAILVFSLIILWFILTRKRRSRSIDGGYIKNSFHRWKGSRDLRGGFDANAPSKRYRSSRHLTSQHGSIGSTFEGGIIGAEKQSTDKRGVAMSALPVLNRQSSRTRPDHTYSASSSSSIVNEFGKSSSARYSNQHSIDSSAIYPPSSRESGQYIPSSDVLRSHSLSTTGTQYSLSNTIDPSFPPPPSSTGSNKQTRRQSIGKKRKPAPVYKPSEADEHEPLSSTSAVLSNQHSTNTELSSPSPFQRQLSHKNSFGPGGIEGKPLHYLIPDMPLSQSS